MFCNVLLKETAKYRIRTAGKKYKRKIMLEKTISYLPPPPEFFFIFIRITKPINIRATNIRTHLTRFMSNELFMKSRKYLAAGISSDKG
jgi:hypothetical protein